MVDTIDLKPVRNGSIILRHVPTKFILMISYDKLLLSNLLIFKKSMSQVELATKILEVLRNNILSQEQTVDPSCYIDRWNEDEGGAAWVDNEFGIFDEMNSLPGDKWITFKSIDQVKHVLIQKDVDYLQQLLQFMKNGGTGSPESDLFFSKMYDKCNS